jgi:hypothetical protein
MTIRNINDIINFIEMYNILKTETVNKIVKPCLGLQFIPISFGIEEHDKDYFIYWLNNYKLLKEQGKAPIVFIDAVDILGNFDITKIYKPILDYPALNK